MCLGCGQQIRIAKIDSVSPGQKKKWEKYKLEGATLHVCHKQQPEQSESVVLTQKEPPAVAISDLADEVTELKSQIKGVVIQIRLMRKGLQMKK